MAELLDTVHATIRPGEDGWYVVDCQEIAVVTQGKTLDEAVANLKEAVEVHVEGEDLAELGLAPGFVVIATIELRPKVYA
jgi:predicted RNase H-like HicB family nuclease